MNNEPPNHPLVWAFRVLNEADRIIFVHEIDLLLARGRYEHGEGTA
jgi:hypothetical protein